MPKNPDEQALWDVIKRNPRLDNLITYYLRCHEAQELLAAAEPTENEE